jgi:hypothetical protein
MEPIQLITIEQLHNKREKKEGIRHTYVSNMDTLSQTMARGWP